MMQFIERFLILLFDFLQVLMYHLQSFIECLWNCSFISWLGNTFEQIDGVQILAVECSPSRVPIYVKDGQLEHFFIRAGNSTSELQGTQAQEYIRLRFRL